MANVTSATASEGPFNGTWEQACVGWGSSDCPETFGSIDSAPSGLIGACTMASGVVIPSGAGTGYNSDGVPVIVMIGTESTTLSEMPQQIVVLPPGGGSLTLNPSNADFLGYCGNTGFSVGAPGSSAYPTMVWAISGASTAFVADEVTELVTAADITLVGEAAGNAGTDVLLTWTPDTCADTTFTIYKDGVAISPVLSQPNRGFVVSRLDASTTYEFYVVGDVNGVSNTVSVTTGCRGAEVFNCDCTLVSEFATLSELRQRILIRLGYPNQAANPPPGMTALVNDFLYSAQKLIWKQLSRAGINVERFFRWVMVPGQRYYGFSANADNCTLSLDPTKIVWAGFEDLNRAWYRLTEGVPPEFYTRANINFGWPTHYEVRSCIEIFPAPQAPYTLWIKGDFGLASFTADDDAATVDDEAIFLLALGNAKAHYKQGDSSQVLAQADTYIRGLVAGMHGTRRYVPRTRIQNPATPPRFLPLGDGQA